MKKYSNIPIKERKRNAERVYRHEVRLEEIKAKRLIKEKSEHLNGFENDFKTEKELEFERQFAELKAALGIEK